MQCNRLALVVEKWMAFGNGGIAVQIANGRITFARDATTRKIHVWRAACHVTTVFEFITDADRVFHLKWFGPEKGGSERVICYLRVAVAKLSI